MLLEITRVLLRKVGRSGSHPCGNVVLNAETGVVTTLLPHVVSTTSAIAGEPVVRRRVIGEVLDG